MDDNPGLLVSEKNLPPELVNAIKDHFGEMLPGFEVCFTGDMPKEKISGGLLEQMKMEEKSMLESMAYGHCKNCEKKIPGEWPPQGEDDFDTPEGWHLYSMGEGDDYIGYFICDECEQKTPLVAID